MVTDHDEYIPIIINKQASLNESASKLKLFKK